MGLLVSSWIFFGSVLVNHSLDKKIPGVAGFVLIIHVKLEFCFEFKMDVLT